MNPGGLTKEEFCEVVTERVNARIEMLDYDPDIDIMQCGLDRMYELGYSVKDAVREHMLMDQSDNISEERALKLMSDIICKYDPEAFARRVAKRLKIMQPCIDLMAKVKVVIDNCGHTIPDKFISEAYARFECGSGVDVYVDTRSKYVHVGVRMFTGSVEDSIELANTLVIANEIATKIGHILKEREITKKDWCEIITYVKSKEHYPCCSK